MIQKTGTHIADSAGTHASILRKGLDKYDLVESDMRSFINAFPFTAHKYRVVHQDSPPTQLIKMNTDAAMLTDIERQMKIRALVDAKISNVAAGTYFPFSLQFENGVLFLPAAKRFYEANKDVVRQVFPEVETMEINAFFVPANQRPYGVHNAGSIGFQIANLAKRGYAYPIRQLSFHTAVTPTPLNRQPLGIFEYAEVESPNTSFLYDAIKSHNLSPEEAQDVDKAFYLHGSGKLSELDLVPMRDYLLCKYWEKRYSARGPEGAGCYFNAQPGEAVVFDNYKAHGDNTLAISPVDRVTIDLRCYCKVKYPSEDITSGMDFVFGDRQERLRQKRRGIEFLILLFGYESLDEFLKLIYGSHGKDVNPHEMLTTPQFGVYNPGKDYILLQNLDPHYERCLKLYDQIEREGVYRMPARAQEFLDSLATAARS